MSTQAYYKDRLGFDPQEDVRDGPQMNGNSHYYSPRGPAPDGGPHDQVYEENLTKFKGRTTCWGFFIAQAGASVWS